MVISLLQAQLFFLALTRILAILIHVPVLAGPLVPNPVKIGLGVLLAMFLLPWQPLPAGSVELQGIPFAVAIARELLVGTLAGFSAVLVFGVMQVAGEVIGIASGFAAGKILNPALESSGSALDQFLIILTMILFLVINGHHSLILGIQRTFTAIPLNTPLPELQPERLVRLAADMIAAGIQVSLPVLGALLLADLTAGLLARVAPQIQVFFLAVPVKVAVGLLSVAFVLESLLPRVGALFLGASQRALQLLGG